MGQFMDHDMTFDATSPLGQPTDPTTSRNARTAAFDLDSVYGLGPLAAQHSMNRRIRRSSVSASAGSSRTCHARWTSMAHPAARRWSAILVTTRTS
jgi:hypothetical protein